MQKGDHIEWRQSTWSQDSWTYSVIPSDHSRKTPAKPWLHWVLHNCNINKVNVVRIHYNFGWLDAVMRGGIQKLWTAITFLKFHFLEHFEVPSLVADILRAWFWSKRSQHIVNLRESFHGIFSRFFFFLLCLFCKINSRTKGWEKLVSTFPPILKVYDYAETSCIFSLVFLSFQMFRMFLFLP